MKSWLTSLIIDGHHIPVIVDPDAKWIEIKDHQPCPDCEAARREQLRDFVYEQLRIEGLKAYQDGLADSEHHPSEED